MFYAAVLLWLFAGLDIGPVLLALDLLATGCACALLVLAWDHRQIERVGGFAAFLADALRFGLPPRPPIDKSWNHLVSALAFYVVASGIVLGLAGVVPLAFAGAFALADRQISHRLLGWWAGSPSPGIESGPVQTALGLALVVLDPSLLAAVAGAAALVGFLGALWLYGRLQALARRFRLA